MKTVPASPQDFSAHDAPAAVAAHNVAAADVAAANNVDAPEVAGDARSRSTAAMDADDDVFVDAREMRRRRGVTPRVVCLCLGLAVFFGYIIPVIDVRLSNTFLGAQHLPPGAVGALLVLLLVVNPLLRLFSKRLVLARNELLTVYISCLFSCLVPGHGAENFFIPNLLGPFYYGTGENGWLALWQKYLPAWFSPALWADHANAHAGALASTSGVGQGTYGDAGRTLVQDWYSGNGGVVPWQLWFVPLVMWGALVVAMYVMLGCLSVMLRAQWGENEALAFPLNRLPLAMTEDADARRGMSTHAATFFKNPLMWIGFGVAVFIQAMNGLNLYYPDVPKVPMSIDLGSLFSDAPWNQIGWTPLNMYPIAVGITFLLTSEVAFSLWFFYWFIKLQYIFAYYLGFVPNSLPGALGGDGRIYTSFQRIGATVAYVAIVLWTGREHFAHIARRAFNFATRKTPPTEAEQSEALSYPAAFWGFALALAFILGWSMLAGISLSLAVSMWVAYLVTAIALSRVIAEGGYLFVASGWTPLGALGQLFHSGVGTWLSPLNGIVPAGFIQAGLMTDQRGFLMPSFVQSFKLAHDRGISARPLLALISAVTLITLGMSFWMNVRIGYESGGLTCDGWFAKDGARQAAYSVNDIFNGSRDASWGNAVWLLVGGLITWGLMLGRAFLPGFALHPIGFLTCLTYPTHMLWFSIFLGWLCKVTITRFGGIDTYRKMVPAFLGLVLGDVAMILFWLLIDGWQGRTGHHLTPA